MKILTIVFCLLGVFSTIVSIDEQSLVYIAPDSSLYLTLSANPTTGYSWVLVPFESENFSIEDGGFISSNKSVVGAGGTQIFIAYSFEETEDGDLIDVEFDYVRSWETSPAQTKLVRIQATTDPSLLAN